MRDLESQRLGERLDRFLGGGRGELDGTVGFERVANAEAAEAMLAMLEADEREESARSSQRASEEAQAEESSSPDEGESNDWMERAIGLREGQKIGDFELVRFLGAGGMAQVWEAYQREMRRSVALKLIQPLQQDERSLDLFEREARAGGRLSHPNLVTTFAQGADNGVCWIAQELVPGSWTLKDLLDELRTDDVVPRGWYRRVARLAARVADGLQAAHDAGVIHRDVKPQNILITPGDVPKVTDFGIARVADDPTASRTGEVAGTYAYMSPEQITANRMGLDHRTDVFSLGVVLYELLTLRRPFEGDTTHQIAAKIIGVDPSEPRRVRSQCPPELSVIACKAIEKYPDRRYAGMAEFAADLRRFLADEPILARPPGRVTRARKWVRRNPVLATSAALGLVALGVVSTLLALLVQKSGQLEDQRDTAREMLAFQAGLFGDVDLAVLGGEVREGLVREVHGGAAWVDEPEGGEERVDRLEELVASVDFTRLAVDSLDAHLFAPAVAEVGQRFEERPVVQAELLQTLATTLRELGSWESALAPQEQALALRGAHLGPEDEDTLESARQTVRLLVQLERLDRARDLAEDTLEKCQRVLGPAHRATLESASVLATVHYHTGELEPALELLEPALETARAAQGEEDELVGLLSSNLAALRYGAGELEEARRLFEEAWTTDLRVLGPDHRQTLTARNNLGVVCRELGELDEARRHFEEGLAALRRTLGEAHPQSLNSVVLLAGLLREEGELERARDLTESALDAARPQLGSGHTLVLDAQATLAAILADLGETPRALELARGARDLAERVLEPENAARVKLERLVAELEAGR